MSKEPLYTTQRAMEEFAVECFRRTGEPLRLQDLVQKMEEQGQLSAGEPLRKPLGWMMSTQEFVDTFFDLPINVEPVLESADQSYTDLFWEERAAFPAGQDVFCRKMLPCLVAEPRTLSYFELFYIVFGECEMSIGREKLRLQKGDLCIVPPDTIHALPVDPECYVADIQVRASTFDAQFGDLLTKSGALSGFFRESLFGKASPNYLILHTPGEDVRVRTHLRGLITECYSGDSHTNDCVICWLKLFLAQALRAGRDEVEVFRSPTGGGPRADCGEILQYIQTNYRTVRLSTLAERFHYNETYLSRMLQNFAHRSFTEIVRDIRMKRADEYLNNSSLRVHEIATLVGYSSVDHFSRAFKATHGVSPQAYRRHSGKKAAVDSE